VPRESPNIGTVKIQSQVSVEFAVCPSYGAKGSPCESGPRDERLVNLMATVGAFACVRVLHPEGQTVAEAGNGGGGGGKGVQRRNRPSCEPLSALKVRQLPEGRRRECVLGPADSLRARLVTTCSWTRSASGPDVRWRHSHSSPEAADVAGPSPRRAERPASPELTERQSVPLCCQYVAGRLGQFCSRWGEICR
jgi:hypothetical protein